MIIKTLGALACVAIGFVAGAWWSPNSSAAAAPPLDQTLLLARVVRLEQQLAANYPVQASATGVRPLRPVSAEPEVPPPLTPAQQEGVRAGNEVVDRAIAMGRWSDKDVETLEAATTELDSLERVKILQRVAAAINSDQVRVETMRTPY